MHTLVPQAELVGSSCALGKGKRNKGQLDAERMRREIWRRAAWPASATTVHGGRGQRASLAEAAQS